MSSSKSYFPFIIDMKNKKIIFVGGGKVAERKIKALLKITDGVNIHIYSLDLTDEIKSIIDSKKIFFKHIDANNLAKSDLEPYDIIIASTNDNNLNEKICKMGKDLKKLVLNVSDKNSSDLFFPSTFIIDDIVVAISSFGKNPSKVKKIREMLEDFFETQPE